MASASFTEYFEAQVGDEINETTGAAHFTAHLHQVADRYVGRS